jgi:16S rRNA (guanine1207-N2)-methyltransferase/23S rRNA (guanine1835-N2)-methyltransferase
MFCQYQGFKEALPEPTLIEDSAVNFKLLNLANVFSREQVDVGARLLLKQLPDCNQQQVIDLGCGNGILGIQTLLNNPEAHLTFVDESYMAVESARQNLMNAQGHTDNASFVVSNCLDEVLMKQRNFADHILCNPPFHQQNVITDHIAYQMFTDSKKALKPGGQVRIVANRHLDYPHKLNKLFDGHEVLASNSKFSVMACIN